MGRLTAAVQTRDRGCSHAKETSPFGTDVLTCDRRATVLGEALNTDLT